MEGRTDELREEALWALDQETVVRRLYEAFAAWDMEPVAGLLSVDVRLSRAGDPGNAGDHRGLFSFRRCQIDRTRPIGCRLRLWKPMPQEPLVDPARV